MYWNKKVETMNKKELKELQEKKLRYIVEYCYKRISFYKKLFKENNLSPHDIRTLEDLKKVPFTEKKHLRDNYPFGMLAVDRSEVVRYHASSGTTGKPTVVAYTKKDIEWWAELMARVLTAVGITKNDTIQLIYNYAFFTGGLGFHYGAEKIGAGVIPAGVGNSKKQLTVMKDFEVTAFSSTPSYAIYLAEVAKKEGIDLDSLKLRVGVFGAEAWSEKMRKKIEDAFNIEAYDNYGLSELCGPGVSVECKYKNGLHVWEDSFIVEVIDPETGEVLDEGERGELVFTTLDKEAMPLIRYRTRDISKILGNDCACGRTHVLIDRISGRSDDMLIVRGVNVFPSQIEHVLLSFKELSENYRIIVERDILDKLKVEVEVSPDLKIRDAKDIAELKKKVEEELKSALDIKAEVILLEPGSLPRYEGKAKRIVDMRDDV